MFALRLIFLPIGNFFMRMLRLSLPLTKEHVALGVLDAVIKSQTDVTPQVAKEKAAEWVETAFIVAEEFKKQAKPLKSK